MGIRLRDLINILDDFYDIRLYARDLSRGLIFDENSVIPDIYLDRIVDGVSVNDNDGYPYLGITLGE